WKELQQSLPQRRVELNISPLPVACRADEKMIRQVFSNLLSNALKFTKDREQTTIAVGCEENPNEYIYYVRDDGVGFDMSFAVKLKFNSCKKYV
ncbi:MAG TPA: ATP-binding protein, partial [Syntrophales bacterium]|nr:ATP-binding protein [Syntrophales bacterium]